MLKSNSIYLTSPWGNLRTNVEYKYTKEGRDFFVINNCHVPKNITTFNPDRLKKNSELPDYEQFV